MRGAAATNGAWLGGLIRRACSDAFSPKSRGTMGTILKFAVAGIGLMLIAGCQTYPYASSFSYCDRQAGACYRDCEYYAESPGEYSACHADCEYQADRCFANAYEPYRYAGSPYGPTYVAPWYGSYGAWYPQTGYVISLGVVNRYGYSRSRRGYYDRGYDRRPDRQYRGRRDGRGSRDRRGRRGRDASGPAASGGTPPAAPPARPPRRATPPSAPSPAAPSAPPASQPPSATPDVAPNVRKAPRRGGATRSGGNPREKREVQRNPD